MQLVRVVSAWAASANDQQPLAVRTSDLVTERLSLRRPSDGDIDAIVSIVGDWEVARRLARVPHFYGPDDAQFFLDQVVPAEWVWAITLQGSDVLIGAVGLTPESDAETAELGYWLSPTHWGRGIVTEAARAVVFFGFESVGFPSLESGYFEDNSASGQILHKLGFVETGRAMRPCLAAGGEVPSVRMKLPRLPDQERRSGVSTRSRLGSNFEKHAANVALPFRPYGPTLGPMRQAMFNSARARGLAGLAVALALPALATFRTGFTDTTAAVALALTPWLTLAWVVGVERRPLSSIGLRRPRWSLLPLGLAGITINVAITAGVTAICAQYGLQETQSALMDRLLQGPGLVLVLLATNGALLTEISFRAFALERFSANAKSAAFLQILITTSIFVVGRGWAHGVVWLVDDLVFTLYYLRTRNTSVCIVAHAIPNLFASSVVALGLAS